MTRNLDRRVEYMLEVENETVHEQIIDQIMVTNILDNVQAWELDCNGKYTRVKTSGKPLSAHNYFMNNPSLSGRGSAPLLIPPRARRSLLLHDGGGNSKTEKSNSNSHKKTLSKDYLISVK